MKRLILLPALSVLIISAGDCSSKKEATANRCKGRLEIKGICLNYTIKLLEGQVDTSKIHASWKDESSGKTYTNVFGLGDPCRFPDSLKEGDEFYFTVDTIAPKECMICNAYYPTPVRTLVFKVLEK